MLTFGSMKLLLPFLLLLLLPMSGASVQDMAQAQPTSLAADVDLCIHGRIEIVQNFEDLRVKVVDNYEDLDVKWVKQFPEKCGEWQLVKENPDIRIKFVKSNEDIRVKFVNDFPGVN